MCPHVRLGREKYSRYFKTPENEDNNQLNHIFGENEHKEDVGIVFDNAQINIFTGAIVQYAICSEAFGKRTKTRNQ